MSSSFDPTGQPIDPNATAEDLARIAAARPDLGAHIAWHPNAYPELLDWLDAYGDPAARQAVQARRAGVPGVPAEQPVATDPKSLQRTRPRLSIPWIGGIAVLVVALATSAALAIGPIRNLFGRSDSSSATQPPASKAQPENFGIDAKPTFLDGAEVAWKLDLSQVQPTGEDPAFNDIADYGDFWLISTSDSLGDLAHGGKATAVDAASGKVLWSVADGATERDCAKKLVAGRLICRHDVDEESRVESIDPATGAITVEPSPGFEVGAVVAVGDSYLAVGSTQDGVGVRLARVEPGSGPQWKSVVPGWCSNPGDYGQTSVDVTLTDRYLAVNVDYCLGAILDPGTGKVSDAFGASNLAVLDGGLAADVPYCLANSDSSEFCGGSASRSVSEVALPDGSRLPLRKAPAEGYARSGTASVLDPAPASWYFEEGDDCYLGKVVDAATGRTIWGSSDGQRGTCPVQVGEGVKARPAFVVEDGEGERLTILDPVSGRALWERTIVPPLSFTGDLGFSSVLAPDDQTILVADDHGLNAFSAADGQLAWSGLKSELPQDEEWPWRVVVAGPNGASVVERGDSRIVRLVPAAAPTRVESMPSGIPDCPTGWTPISWSSWDGGHTLVCRTSAKSTYYVEYVDGSQTYRSDAATTAPTGWKVEFSGGPQISVSFSGAMVQASQGGAEPVTRYPSAAWQHGQTATFTKPPSSLPGCPAGSWPLSLSTWDGGWLLVCGTAADAPTSMVFSDGSRNVAANSVSYTAGVYCGQAGDAKVCAYQAPAVVTETPSAGQVVQHSVTQNWFAGSGSGGVGEGKGSYGVDTPDVSAADQLRYLDQILAKSKAARQTLSPSINAVRSCKQVSSAVKRIDAVTANREELLAALDSAPVDAFPEGSQLVSDLQHVLALSRDTDRAYADWARAEQANGCSGGTKSSEWAQAQAADKAVDGPKNAFVSYWNSTIVGKYDVRMLSNSDI